MVPADYSSVALYYAKNVDLSSVVPHWYRRIHVAKGWKASACHDEMQVEERVSVVAASGGLREQTLGGAKLWKEDDRAISEKSWPPCIRRVYMLGARRLPWLQRSQTVMHLLENGDVGSLATGGVR